MSNRSIIVCYGKGANIAWSWHVAAWLTPCHCLCLFPTWNVLVNVEKSHTILPSVCSHLTPNTTSNLYKGMTCKSRPKKSGPTFFLTSSLIPRLGIFSPFATATCSPLRCWTHSPNCLAANSLIKLWVLPQSIKTNIGVPPISAFTCIVCHFLFWSSHELKFWVHPFPVIPPHLYCHHPITRSPIKIIFYSSGLERIAHHSCNKAL